MKQALKQSKILAAGVIALALVAGACYAQGADYKIGFVNTERLFREAAPAKRAQQKRRHATYFEWLFEQPVLKAQPRLVPTRSARLQAGQRFRSERVDDAK